MVVCSRKKEGRLEFVVRRVRCGEDFEWPCSLTCPVDDREPDGDDDVRDTVCPTLVSRYSTVQCSEVYTGTQDGWIVSKQVG